MKLRADQGARDGSTVGSGSVIAKLVVMLTVAVSQQTLGDIGLNDVSEQQRANGDQNRDFRAIRGSGKGQEIESSDSSADGDESRGKSE